MTQQDYNLICEIIQCGAPALSERLILLLSDLITDYQNKTKELESIKSSVKKSSAKKSSAKKSEDK